MKAVLPSLSSTQQARRRRRLGFSLAEVTIALAIAAGGFVSLLGLLPHGLDLSRRSAEMAAKTRIVDYISGELASTPWQNLSWTGHGTTDGMRRYFDDQGVEVQPSEISAGAFVSYVASVYLPPQNAMEVKLPLTSGNSQQEKYMKRALVFIAQTPDQSFSFPAPDSLPRNVSYSALLIPDMGLPTP
ncbi:Verru_Chthon cassette protein B [Verrucomicrobium sp. BvORR106]|uniref:Verru_Chthon cassette protein B n=1 Tax=Verrucomicrobium sp. BvORR106 TaxID=1403819 RepID=UPI000570BAB9|nr:Verru_Chthon cassette protein B [Verrucomicrobium sp. BvORR106]